MILDTTVYQWLYVLRTDIGISVFRFVTSFGSTTAVLVLAVLLTLYLYHRHGQKLSSVFVWGIVVNEAIVYLLKIMVHRSRPLLAVVTENDFSFPSGHTAASVFFYGFLIFYATKYITNTFWRGVVRVVSAVLCILVPISRLYLGEHYLTDVLASIIIASTVILFTVKWWEKASVEAQN